MLVLLALLAADPVPTTLDPALQARAEQVLARQVRVVDQRTGWRGPSDNLHGERRIRRWIRHTPRHVDGPREAVVLEVRPDAARVALDRHTEAWLPLEHARWARRPDPEVDWREAELDDLQRVMRTGDLVQVEVIGLAPVAAPTTSGLPRGDRVVALHQEPEVHGALVAVDRQDGAIRAWVSLGDGDEVTTPRALGTAFLPVLVAVLAEQGVERRVLYRWLGDPEPLLTARLAAAVDPDATRLYTLARAVGLGRPSSGATDPLAPSPETDTLCTWRPAAGLPCPGLVLHGDGAWCRDCDLTLALGRTSDDLLDVVLAYAALTGLRVTPRRDPHAPVVAGRVLDQAVAHAVEDAMSAVASRRPHPRGHRHGHPEPPREPVLPGLAGTSRDAGTVWYVGLTPDLAVGLWLGRADEAPLGRGHTGALDALPAWRELVTGTP